MTLTYKVEIERIPDRNQISALKLETKPLKLRLAEISEQWKSQYALLTHYGYTY